MHLGDEAMPVHDDLVAHIRRVVREAAAAGYNDGGATNDIYENYIWAVCLRAARQHGAGVSFWDVREIPADNLVFRTAPGAIYGMAHNYTHALLSFPESPPLEVHVGVKVTGKSRVLHECDVAVIDSEEAQLCRREQVHPRAAKVLIAAECKFYTNAIQLHLGRGFLGLTSDIQKKDRYFVTNGSSSSVNKLISYHQVEWEFRVLPHTAEEEALRHSFARVFRNYRARFR